MTAEVSESAAEQQTVPVKKNFDVLKVIAEKVSGTVKWFSVSRHYGFIQRDDNKEDVFVHRTAISASRSRFPTLKNGESVEFSVVETTGGINAASVTGPNGQNVQGVRYFRRRYRSQANGGDAHSSMNGGTSQASGDGEGSRPQRGGGRMRRGRRNFRPSQNGGSGDSEGHTGEGEQGEDQTGGESGNSRPPRQRPRRFRGRGGGRGGGRPRSTSTRQAGEGGQEGGNGAEDGGAPASGAEGSRGARRGNGRFRRGGGRFRRGGSRNGGPSRDGEASGENNADNLETKMENMSLGEKQQTNTTEGGNGESAPVKSDTAEDGSN